MKKIIATLLVLVFAFILVGCVKDPTLDFTKKEYSLEVGGSETLSPVITNLEGAAVDLVVYTPSDPTIVSITNGVMNGLKEGSTEVVASLKDYADAEVTLTVTVSNVVVTNITISGPGTVVIGNSIQLTATVEPSNATIKNVTWSVAETNIATVDNNGLVTGLAYGTAVITAESGTKSKTFTVNVERPGVTTIIVDGTSSMIIGATQTLVAEITPGTALQEVVWTSSDDNIATISSAGLVTAISAGTAIITATANDGSETTGSFTITVEEATATSITIAGNSAMKVGDTQQLTATVEPSAITRNDNTWSSSNNAIATVSTEGLVTAIGAGTVTIKVVAGGTTDVMDTISITVTGFNTNTILVDPAYNVGESFIFEGIEYRVGNNAFKTLKEAYDAVNPAGTIILNAGTYNDSFTISKSVSIIGPNKNVDPNIDTRGEEAVLSGTITLATVTKVSINGIKLTGKIASTAKLQDITLAFLDVVNTAAASTTWTSSTSNVAATISLYNTDSTSSESAISTKIAVKNCRFDVRDYTLSFARVSNITITNNVFLNNERDSIRFDGGFNFGTFTIDNNKFINDELSGYNGIYFRIVGGFKDKKGQEIYIRNNEFKNIGTGTVSYSGAISSTNYQETGVLYEVNYNTFTNCYNAMSMRNNASAANHTAYPWIFDGQFNVFVGVPTGYYFKSKFSGDTATSNPPLAVLNNCLFMDDNGEPIVDLTAYANKFLDVASYINNFPSKSAYDLYKLGINDPITKVVDGNWATLGAGEEVEVFGSKWTIGTNAFGSFEDALAAAVENDGIYICAGTYSGTFTISINGLKIYGPNANVDPNFDKRNPEAMFAGESKIVVSANVDGLKLQGLAFTSKAFIDVVAGGIKNFTLSYCNFTDSTIASGALGMLFGRVAEGSTAYNENFLVEYSRFYGLNDSRAINLTFIDGLTVKDSYFKSKGTFYADAIITSNIKGALIIENNTIESYAQFGLFIGATTNNASSISILNNTFNNFPWSDGAATGMAIVIRNYSQNPVSIMYNTFENIASGGTAIAIRHVSNPVNPNITINNNLFLSTSAHYFQTLSGTAKTGKDDANLENNYFADSGYANKVDGIAITNTYATAEEVPTYPAAPKVKVSGITILNEIESLEQLKTHQIEYNVTPSKAANKKVTFISSDSNIATVSDSGLITALKEGSVKIYVTSVENEDIEAVMEFEVKAATRIEINLDGETTLEIGDEVTVEPTVVGAGEISQVTWTSSNSNIATITSTGLIKAIGEGTVTFTGTIAGYTSVTVEFSITVINKLENLDALLQKFVEYNYSRVLYQNIKVTGFQFIYQNNLYGSVSLYSFDPNTITEQIAPIAANRPGTKKVSTEYIVVHDTGSADATANAKAHAVFVGNGGGTGNTSWSYSVGNDGVYHQIPDDEVSYHAGDGTRPYAIENSNIVATGSAEDAIITLNANGCYEINGQLTTLRPYKIVDGDESIDTVNYTTAQINDYGIHCVVKDGKYYLGKTYFNGTYKLISNYGGNRSSIGMETMVNQGSNLYWTWHKAAKLSAKLCIENNLDLSRVRPHHYFSGKNCPQTMRDNDLWDEFLLMTAAEYNIQKNFSDYTIQFENLSPTILDNFGNVINPPLFTTSVSYKVTVTKGGVSKSIVLTSIVEGTLAH